MFGQRTLSFGVQTEFGLRTLMFGLRTLCSVCRVRRPNSDFADRTQRLHSEREGSLTELTVRIPNLSVRRPNSVYMQT